MSLFTKDVHADSPMRVPTSRRRGPEVAGERPARLPLVGEAFTAVEAEYERLAPTEPPGVVSFVENKSSDLDRIADFLTASRRFNRWANRGPVWHALSRSYAAYLADSLTDKRVVPCANGGMALEAMANLHSLRAGRPLRWCVSSFSFANTGRGRFAEAIVVDCDERGLLSLAAVAELASDSYDGIIVTNPFGLLSDFSAFEAWQRATGKLLLLDNAAGMAPSVPDLPWQAFSLHQTKPYGYGEGGLAIVPEEDAEAFLSLLEYGALTRDQAPYWINNGKVSDIGCAGHLARLEAAPEWLPRYRGEARRIAAIAAEAGLEVLCPVHPAMPPAMSLPVLAPSPVPIEAVLDVRHGFRLGKYYKPLAPTANAARIYDRIVNVPSHPDMGAVDHHEIVSSLRHLATCGA